jgi:hypothetical protein
MMHSCISFVIGTAFQAYGELTGQTPRSATYQLDGGDPEEVFQGSDPLPPGISLAGTGSYIHQLLLNLPSISPGEHTVTLTYNGTSSGMPLTIEYFLVTSPAEEEQASSSTSGNPSSAPSSSDQGHSSPSSHKGGMIGGIVGGVIFLGLVLSLVFLRRKRQRRSRALRRMNELEPTPFTGASDLIFANSRKRSTNPNQNHDSFTQVPTQQTNSGNTENRLVTEPVIHADSGWRMAHSEVPPNYTEV